VLAETVAPILDQDAVLERADDLEAAGLNGLRLVLVALGPGPAQAQLEVHFFNALHVADILAAVTAAPPTAASVFRIRGGHRVKAGPGIGQVKCTGVAAGSTPRSLLLTVEPVGDYSTYTLELSFDPTHIDPFFAEVPFKFRPGCFTNDCAPGWAPGIAREPAPTIDYLAKDYDSFRHTLVAAMMQRVPGWRVTSEADLDQVLIDLFAAAADELSDYQDRVANEAYLATARSRVSLARHARLVDYHIHQGNQSSTWLVIILEDGTAPFFLDDELRVWAGHPDAPAEWIHFASRQLRLDPAARTSLSPLFNELHLHTWSDARPALPAGATSADVVSTDTTASPTALAAAINAGQLECLVLEEKLNPLTGRNAGRDPRKRQRLRLIPDASPLLDPLTGITVTRIHWQPADALRFAYSFTTTCPTGRVPNVSAFHGNVLRVHQGLPVQAHFYEPGTPLPMDTSTERHRYYERWLLRGERRGVRCALPFVPLAYLPTSPGGEQAPRSTLHVEVDVGPARDPWDEVDSLVHSDDSPEEGDHFVAETDELGRSTLRFGNGINGRWLPDGAIVRCEYQVGGGTIGNVGAGMLTHFEPVAAHPSAIESVWNPFDVVDGADPEPVERILRNAPEAYRARQLRAVTLADYIRRAEEVPGVARAVARYAWSGSWRTVRIVLDPVGTTTLAPELSAAVARHLEAVRLIGEDLELRRPRFVPLVIEIKLCLHPDYWPQDVRFVLEQEFSAGWTPDGRRGLFHPDEWTFGQALHASLLAGRAHAISGIEHIVSISMRRFDAKTPGKADAELLELAFDEIVLVQNDPDHMERGSITFDLEGGRQ